MAVHRDRAHMSPGQPGHQGPGEGLWAEMTVCTGLWTVGYSTAGKGIHLKPCYPVSADQAHPVTWELIRNAQPQAPYHFTAVWSLMNK